MVCESHLGGEMSGFGKRYSAFDQFQQRHRWLGFPLAVLQKYADDQGGYLAATITYYGFFAIFPLLLVLTTLAGRRPGAYSHPTYEVGTGGEFGRRGSGRHARPALGPPLRFVCPSSGERTWNAASCIDHLLVETRGARTSTSPRFSS